MRRYLIHACLMLLLGSPGVLGAGEANSSVTVTVIASPSVGQNGIPLSTVRAIFAMRLHRWPDGTPVKVFVFKDDASEHQAFSKQVLQVFPHQLRQNWDRLVFSGIGQYPEQVESAEAMLAKVAATPGAIGYVGTQEVNQNVRALHVR